MRFRMFAASGGALFLSAEADRDQKQIAASSSAARWSQSIASEIPTVSTAPRPAQVRANFTVILLSFS